MVHSRAFPPHGVEIKKALSTLVYLAKGLVMKLSAHALRSLQELDEAGRKAVEQIVQAHIRACLLNGFQPENLERVYQGICGFCNQTAALPDGNGCCFVFSATFHRKYSQWQAVV